MTKFCAPSTNLHSKAEKNYIFITNFKNNANHDSYLEKKVPTIFIPCIHTHVYHTDYLLTLGDLFCTDYHTQELKK